MQYSGAEDEQVVENSSGDIRNVIREIELQLL